MADPSEHLVQRGGRPARGITALARDERVAKRLERSHRQHHHWFQDHGAVVEAAGKVTLGVVAGNPGKAQTAPLVRFQQRGRQGRGHMSHCSIWNIRAIA